MPLSLWLLPPEKEAASLKAHIDSVASAHGLHTTTPHITVLGDVSYGRTGADDVASAIQRLATLGECWTGGSIECNFTEIYTSDVWNQAAVAIVLESGQLLQLQQLARHLFFSESLAETTVTPAWAWPLCKPHLSLTYGVAVPVSELTLPDAFVTDTIALWDCTPATTRGVSDWREVARINLGRGASASRPPCPVPLKLGPLGVVA
mmetsp:Transcript_52/g.168  ORF Transcript_52/g.168 Transcript_52/m.168 type:complete len:206 (+) Transcript_52:3403-4020(+)